MLFANLEIEPTPRAAEKEAINQMSEETQMTFSMGKTAQKYARTEEELNELLYRGKAAKAAEERRRENVKPLQNEANNLFCKRKDSNKLSKGDFDESTDTHNQTTIKPEFKAPVSMEEALSGFEDKASLQREEIESVMTLRETAENTEKYSTCTVEHSLSACHPIAYFPLSNPSFHFSVDYCCSNNSKCSASFS